MFPPIKNSIVGMDSKKYNVTKKSMDTKKIYGTTKKTGYPYG